MNTTIHLVQRRLAGHSLETSADRNDGTRKELAEDTWDMEDLRERIEGMPVSGAQRLPHAQHVRHGVQTYHGTA